MFWSATSFKVFWCRYIELTILSVLTAVYVILYSVACFISCKNANVWMHHTSPYTHILCLFPINNLHFLWLHCRPVCPHWIEYIPRHDLTSASPLADNTAILSGNITIFSYLHTTHYQFAFLKEPLRPPLSESWLSPH